MQLVCRNPEYTSEAARTTAEAGGASLLNVLVQQGAVDRKELIRCTVEAAGLEYVEAMDVSLDPEAVSLLTSDQARKYGVVPYLLEGNILTVITDSQTAGDWRVRDDLQAITRRSVKFACSMKSEVARRINQEYRAEAELGALVKDMMVGKGVVDVLDPVAIESDAPLVRYVNLLLLQAITDGASDIHVEPTESSIRIRFRIDGVLKEMAPAPKEIQSAVISRLKIMSDMNIAERRIPQDGRLTVQTKT
ncbi:MAG: ATPase, T2SS/T4P/T4SS family, partial [Candidatus Nanopelagicales bacterium]